MGMLLQSESENLWKILYNLENPVFYSVFLMASITFIIIIFVKSVLIPLTEKHKEEKREIADKEKYRLACELHDNILQKLITIKEIEKENLSRSSYELFNQTVQDIRCICNELIPKELENGGLAEAVHSFIEIKSKKSNIKFNTDIQSGGTRLSQGLELNIPRIIQEAVNNAVKHSKAGMVLVKLKITHNTLSILVSDDGIGFNPGRILPEAKKKNLGLASMKFRTESIGGKFFIDSMPGEGTIIHVEIPIKDKIINDKEFKHEQ